MNKHPTQIRHREKPGRKHPRAGSASLMFLILWQFIIGVSVHDGYLVLANRWTMRHSEQNPLGQWLIQFDQGDVWMLLLVKAVGTFLSATLLLLLFSVRPRLARVVCVPVAIGQLILLCYLYQP